MQIISLSFLGFTTVTLILWWFAGPRPARSLLLFAFNLVFIFLVGGGIVAALPTVLFVVFCFGLIQLTRRYQKTGTAAAILIMMIFVWLRRYAFVAAIPALSFVFSTIGLSYLLFRILHLVFDAQNDRFPDGFSFVSYFNFCCFFPAFFSGPIQKFADFQSQFVPAVPSSLSYESVSHAFTRILNGLIKSVLLCFFLSVLFFQFNLKTRVTLVSHLPNLITQPGGLEAAPIYQLIWLSCAILSFLFYLYWNFSGSMDIVLGVASLFGIHLPENFNHPFSARNFLDFWTRWHITLSDWFRVYAFNPFTRFLLTRIKAAWMKPFAAVAAYFAVFFLIGLWHGTTYPFFFFGLALGLGVSINKLFQLYITPLVERSFLATQMYSGALQHLSRGLALAWFAVSLIAMWGWSDAEYLALFSNGGAFTLLEAFLVTTSCLSLGSLVISLASRLVKKMPAPAFFASPDFSLLLNATKLASLIILLWVIVDPNTSFIYQNF